MIIENALYLLPTWASIAIALLPPMVVIIGIRLFRRSPLADSATLATRATLYALLSTAFAFSVTFSVNTLWSQNTQVYDAATDMAQAGVSLAEAVDEVDDKAASELIAEFSTFLEQVKADSKDISIGGAELPTKTLQGIHAKVSQLSADPDQAKRIEAAFEEIVTARQAWLRALNSPGIPDVIWLNIALLGLIFAGVIAAAPPGKSQRYETSVVAMSGLVIGFFQIPLYVLNSQAFVLTLVSDIFDEFTDQYPSNRGLVTGFVSFIAIAGIFIGTMFLIRRHQTHEESQSEPTGALDAEAD